MPMWSDIISWRDAHIDWHQVNIYPGSQAFYVRMSTYHSQAVHKPPRVSTEGSVSSTPGHFYPTVCQSQVEILHLATGKLVRVMFPTSSLDYFYSRLSGHTPSTALAILSSVSSTCNPQIFCSPPSRTPIPSPRGAASSSLSLPISKGILDFFAWLASHTSSKLARKLLSNLTQAKWFFFSYCSSVLFPCSMQRTHCRKLPYCSCTLLLYY